jgi:hypothetical protein
VLETYQKAVHFRQLMGAAATIMNAMIDGTSHRLRYSDQYVRISHREPRNERGAPKEAFALLAPGANTGASSLTTTNGNKFVIHFEEINAVAFYTVTPLQ